MVLGPAVRGTTGPRTTCPGEQFFGGRSCPATTSLNGAILLVEPYVSLRTYARIELVYSCASDVSYAIDAITYAEWFRI